MNTASRCYHGPIFDGSSTRLRYEESLDNLEGRTCTSYRRVAACAVEGHVYDT